MSFDFPSSPSENQTYTPAGGPTYIYKAPRWMVQGVPGGLADAPNDGKPYVRKSLAWDDFTDDMLLKENTTNKGAVSGYAPLDASSKVPAINLPAYVDDVVEYANLAAFPGSGTAGIIYVALDTNKVYRWSGSAYVEISPSPGSTDAVPEGSTNLYYTTARATSAAIAAIPPATVAPLMDGVAAVGSVAKYAKEDHKHPSDTSKLDSVSYTAADVLTKIKTVDGTTSGLDADLLDGNDSTYYTNATNLASGTLPAARFDDTAHGNRAGGTLHPAVTTSVNGFMIAADKSKLDGVATGATNVPPATVAPLMNGAAAVGSVAKYAKEDHVHPSDTSKLDSATASTTYAPIASPTLTGDPKSVTPSAGDNDTSIATTAFVTTAVAVAKVTLSDTAPGSPVVGSLWYETDTGVLLIYYNDGTSTQWVQIAGSAP